MSTAIRPTFRQSPDEADRCGGHAPGGRRERLRLFERVGAERYSELNAEHLKQQTVATVNGHAIRRVQTRFGEIYFVSETDCAFALLSDARGFARGLS